MKRVLFPDYDYEYLHTRVLLVESNIVIVSQLSSIMSHYCVADVLLLIKSVLELEAGHH
jgi:hypothetical protein